MIGFSIRLGWAITDIRCKLLRLLGVCIYPLYLIEVRQPTPENPIGVLKYSLGRPKYPVGVGRKTSNG